MENKNVIKKKPLRLNLRWECDREVEKLLVQAVQSGKYTSQNDFIKKAILAYGKQELIKGPEKNSIKKADASESAINPLLF